MELLLKNGKRVITMDYSYISGNTYDAIYQRENNVVSSLFNGVYTDLPGGKSGKLEYEFENGSKIIFAYDSGGYVKATVYNSKGEYVKSAQTTQSAMWYLSYNNYHSGAYRLEEFGKETICLASTIYNISDVAKQTEDNQPIVVNMENRGYAGTQFKLGEATATDSGVCSSSYSDIFNAIVKGSVAPTDPYHPGGGGTKPGGGEGTFDDIGDEITIPELPSLSAVDAGFITLFNPTIVEIQQLSSYMWSDLFDIEGWKKIFADPIQAILGLSIVPVAVPNGGSREVKVGNIPTGLTMNLASTQYVKVDCGTLNIEEYWGAYLDYDPYTKAELYLPYIGTHAIATDDIMGKAVQIVYHVDILTGSCCAYVKCGTSVLYSFIGQCSSPIPVTGDNWTSAISGALNIAGSIGSMVATGGASAPLAAGSIASTAVNTLKPSIEKSGAMSGTGGLLGIQKPYLILTRPRQALPNFQNTFVGYPSFITRTLSDLKGYTKVYSIHIEDVPATKEEIDEIETLLKDGVIL